MLSDGSAIAQQARSVFNVLMSRHSSRMMSTTSQVRIGLASGIGATTATAYGSHSDSEPINDESETKPKLEDEPRTNGSVMRSVGEQMSFGGVLGFATGYSIRKVGKAILFLVGTEVVILQYMAYREWLTMDWKRVAKDVTPRFSRSTWEGLLDILVYRMPFSAAFSGGLLAGLRLSAQK